jgi:hypothetical protein
MAKKKGEKYPNETTDDNAVGKDGEKYKASDPKKKLFRVVFKQNRTKEVKVGREFLVWIPNGVNPVYPEIYKDGIPEEIINHKDFQTQKKYFNITEV